ncbi:hypothetical protein AVEN_140120-1 [Araneus ventricosus]|uniref:Uncharacterized protein n=1 Tax=Araneus ventricosus TaxID=182803 RepID=A0A4Y2ELG0_ARAVE|nr:hypothetical protein AVEN_140120-1 [Araneus ventricosus]
MIPVKSDLLQHWLFPQIEQARDDFIFIQGGALPHFQHEVRQYLKDTFVGRWIGKVGNMILLILSGFQGHQILHLVIFICVETYKRQRVLQPVCLAFFKICEIELTKQRVQ